VNPASWIDFAETVAAYLGAAGGAVALVTFGLAATRWTGLNITWRRRLAPLNNIIVLKPLPKWMATRERALTSLFRWATRYLVRVGLILVAAPALLLIYPTPVLLVPVAIALLAFLPLVLLLEIMVLFFGPIVHRVYLRWQEERTTRARIHDWS
jgi:hypothetical protein